jgi:tyrosyl-tRNA synthetase
LAREDFSKRQKAGRPIALTELLYPILQAYDSVVVKADVEFGGIDQKFNCLMGRELQQIMGQPPQQILLTPLLVGTDGVQKMSKSLGNYIAIEDPPDEMFGKVMSIPDSLILDYFELLTDVSDRDFAEFRKQLNSEMTNPMILKKRLAFEIVSQFHSSQKATEAEEHFSQVFQRHKVPEDAQVVTKSEIPEGIVLKTEPDFIVDITSLVAHFGLTKSRSEAKRLLTQGAVELDGQKVSKAEVVLHNESYIKVGKRRFLRFEK